MQHRTRTVLSCLAIVLGVSTGRGQPVLPPPSPCPPQDCPKVCLPKPSCCGLFKKPAHTCAACEKTLTAPAPKITVIVPPPVVEFRTVPAPAASAPVCAKAPVCTKVAAPVPTYAAPQPVYAAPPLVYAAPAPFYAAPPVMVPQMSYQMVPTVSMQAVPTMTYGTNPLPPCAAPPSVGVGSCAQPQGNNVGGGQGQRFGLTTKDIDAEIDRLTNEIRELGKRVLTNAQKHRELEEKLKKDPEIRKLLESE